MCYRPITISNCKPDKNPLLDKFRLKVPCGHCILCKDEKRMAMWIRTYYEYLECKKLGGFALFVTLTYRNSTIPRLNNDERFKCFSKRDCQKYIKRVRQAIARKYPTIDTSNSIRYLCTSEYGGRTHRPHYHLAFFVRCPLHRWSVRRIVADSWHLGYTKFGSRNYGFIDSVGALHYVSKYICKDVYEEDYKTYESDVYLAYKHDQDINLYHQSHSRDTFPDYY